MFDFGEPPTALPAEGISGPGDSGGPAFGEGDCLLGVSSWQDNREQGGVEGVCGVLEYYVRVSVLTEWIETVLGMGATALRRCGTN